mgnify:CR=1 FL=1
MAHPHLPYTLVIGFNTPTPVRIAVADLPDASHAYQDYRMRNSPTTCPAGFVLIGATEYTVAQDGSVWADDAMIVRPQ